MRPLGAAYAISYGVREGASGWVVQVVQAFGLEDLSAPQRSHKEAEKWLADFLGNMAAPVTYYDATGKALG